MTSVWPPHWWGYSDLCERSRLRPLLATPSPSCKLWSPFSFTLLLPGDSILTHRNSLHKSKQLTTRLDCELRLCVCLECHGQDSIMHAHAIFSQRWRVWSPRLVGYIYSNVPTLLSNLKWKGRLLGSVNWFWWKVWWRVWLPRIARLIWVYAPRLTNSIGGRLGGGYGCHG